jgi:hypothetical protein
MGSECSKRRRETSVVRGGDVRISGDDAQRTSPHTEKTMPSPPRQNWPWPVQIIRLLVALAIAVAVSTALVVLVLMGAQPI